MGVLEGRTAVVTGAAQNLGRAIATHLRDEGARVFIFGRKRETIEATAADLGDRVTGLAVDVGDAAQVEAAYQRISEAFDGRLDLVVNNAAIIDPIEFHRMDVERIQRSVHSNLMGVMYNSKFALPLLRANGGGDIINISSETSIYAAPSLAVYMATKAGIEAFSRGLALEHRAENIRVAVARLGMMKGTSDAPDVERFVELCIQEGHGWILNPGFDTIAVARSVVHMATLPRDVNMTVAELRPTERM